MALVRVERADRVRPRAVTAPAGERGACLWLRLEDERQGADLEQKVYKALLGKLTQADTVDEDLRRLTGTDAVTKNSYIANLYTQWFTLEKEREELRSTSAAERDALLAQLAAEREELHRTTESRRAELERKTAADARSWRVVTDA